MSSKIVRNVFLRYFRSVDLLQELRNVLFDDDCVVNDTVLGIIWYTWEINGVIHVNLLSEGALDAKFKALHHRLSALLFDLAEDSLANEGSNVPLESCIKEHSAAKVA